MADVSGVDRVAAVLLLILVVPAMAGLDILHDVKADARGHRVERVKEHAQESRQVGRI